MRKRLASTLIYVLLGTFASVLVGWGCAMFAESPILRSDRVSGDEARWVIPVDESWPDAPHFVLFGESRGHRVRVAQCVARRPHPEQTGRWKFYAEHRAETHAFGWPLEALRRDLYVTSGERQNRFAIALPAIVQRFSRTRQAHLPLLPLWPGFAVDVLLFATVGWVLLDGHRAVRRAARGWGGRCVGCGYDLRESDAGCPECGGGRREG